MGNNKPFKPQFCLYCGSRLETISATHKPKSKFCSDECCFMFHILPFEDIRKSGNSTPEQRKEMAKK